MDPTDLCLAGAARQAQLVRDRVVSTRELIDATLHQIESLDPRFNAYRTVFADRALQQATDIDSGTHDRTGVPLLGVPVAIKDDTDVAGEVTAWGTDAAGPSAARDAEVVTRLRSAGAIIIGKTNVPELTAWPWTSSPTWGITRNPWDTERTPGGSCGGSASAAATGVCGVALGSDGGGQHDPGRTSGRAEPPRAGWSHRHRCTEHTAHAAKTDGRRPTADGRRTTPHNSQTIWPEFEYIQGS